jgi:DNA polymerase I-like protein with 3'-5' exonuclease and polymerase domains
MISKINEYTGLVEQLVDARNMEYLSIALDRIKEQQGKAFVGFDIETEDSQRHDGLNRLMNVDAHSLRYKKPTKLMFDIPRTNVTGFSFYIKGEDIVYYVNTKHFDVENRIPFALTKCFIEELRDNATLIIHNYTFERTMVLADWGIDLGKNYIDTLQMAVSAYNDDQYDIAAFKQRNLGEIAKLVPEIKKHFKGFDPKVPLSAEQFEVVNKVVSKDSKADHSYNGYVRSMNYGYGLKVCTERLFGYKQDSFEDCLQGKAHMGMLTGEEVLHYGADDSYWCVRLFDWLLEFMSKTNPAVIQTFFEQENPMPYIFSDCWSRGWRVNREAIERRNIQERVNYVRALRDLAELLNGYTYIFPDGNPAMLEKQPKWYSGKEGESFQKYREKLEFFKSGYQLLLQEQGVTTLTNERLESNEMLGFDLCQLSSGSVPAAWRVEMKNAPVKKDLDKRPNLMHYMVQRVLLHDLCNLPFIYIKGKVSTNGEARGKMMQKAEDLASMPNAWLEYWDKYKSLTQLTPMERQLTAEHLSNEYDADKVQNIIRCLNTLVGIDQRIKLFITNYRCMIDPNTDRIHPVLSSKLNTRRMASQNPNAMQLAKRGDSAYIRGFFQANHDDHLIIAVDWSQVELVLIGEESSDPNFAKAFGQLPYEDLHTAAAKSALEVFYPNFSDELFMGLKMGDASAIQTIQIDFPKVLINPVENEPLEPSYAFKFWRSEAGKPSNFGYWYSGSLMTVQEKLGWTSKEMWAGTENYRMVFEIAEHWRLKVIENVKNKGITTLRDNHQRVRYEATDEWVYDFVAKFSAHGNNDLSMFGYHCAKKIQRRAHNQAVNAKIQGGCATLAKRSIIPLHKEIHEEGKWDAEFLMPIHDELVFSAHHSQAVDFSYRILEVMCDHPTVVKNLKLDGTISIGKTLEPFHPVNAPYGQIELDEAPFIDGVIPKEYVKKSLPREIRQKVVDYLRRGSYA